MPIDRRDADEASVDTVDKEPRMTAALLVLMIVLALAVTVRLAVLVRTDGYGRTVPPRSH